MILAADFQTRIHSVHWRRRPIFVVFTGTYQNPGRMEARAWDEYRYLHMVCDFKGSNKSFYHWIRKRSTLIAYAPYASPIHKADWVALEKRGADWVRKIIEDKA